MNSLSLYTALARICLLSIRAIKAGLPELCGGEEGEQQNESAFLLVLVVIAALALVLVVGPQVTMVYAQTVNTGVASP